MKPRLRSIALWAFLLIPFVLREMRITEPYPAMLMPSGAKPLNIDDGSITYSRTEFELELPDGSSQPLDLDHFFLPVPKHFLPRLSDHQFGLAPRATKQLGVGRWILQYVTSPGADEQTTSEVRAWLRERAAGAGYSDATGLRVVRTQRVFDTKQRRESSVEVLSEYTINFDG